MNNKLQEKILHFQILENKIKQIRQKEQNVLMQINELERTKESLDQIKESDSMIPIGAGVFVPAKITDSKHVLIGIGSGTAIKKTADECKEILNNRIKEAEIVLGNIDKDAQKIINELTKVQAEIEKLQSKK
ncbi:MAG: prefoldin subunit alpha [Candidatus Aenigmarchaeota archaeon]|nr:prefoldin subunit alpha [Candidatus Aenigmarchaeota archaeon]